MTIKEFKKMLKKDNHPVMKETIWMFMITIVYIIGLGTLLYLQINNIIPAIVSLIFIVILILIVVPAMIIDLKRDKKLKRMHLIYLKENKIPNEKSSVKTLQMILVSLVVVIVLMGVYVAPKYVLNEEKEKVQKNVTNDAKENFEVKTKDGNVIETEYYMFDYNNFYLKIPKDFDSMSKELIGVKYPNGNVPTYVLTNEETTMNVVANVTQDKITNENIKSFTPEMKETLKQTSTVIETNVYEKEDHNIGEIKFISKASDTDIYNHMIVFSVDNNLRVVSFNCTINMQENWQDVGEFIIDSLTFELK